MRLNCRECGAEIRADDMSLDNLVAKCQACNAVFSFAAEVDASGGGVAAGRDRPRAKVPLPRGISVDDASGPLAIVRRWFSPKYLGLAFFCVLWDGFLVVWYGVAFATDAPLAMKLFPVLHLAVGVGLTYTVVAGFLNRTRIEVEAGDLTIRHGPVPWPGNRSIAAAELDQLYGQERIHRGKHGYSYSYELWAETRSGGKQKLLSGLDAPEQAVYLEQTLEEHLRIRDRAVQGELGR